MSTLKTTYIQHPSAGSANIALSSDGTVNFPSTSIGAAFSTAGSDSIAVDFSGDTIVTRAAAGDVTFAGSNYTAGKSTTVRIVAGASARNVAFPADWVFVSLKPTALSANKVGILSATCFGSAATDVVAGWSDDE